MKPVTLRGFFDHNKEIRVEKIKNGEKGVDVITPFYTHINNKEEPQAILVNRGWLPEDLKLWKYDKINSAQSRLTGVLYRGDNLTKYSKPNQPLFHSYRSVVPRELAIVNNLANEEEASQFMLKVMDFDPNARTVHPTVPSPEELQKWTISPERHEAYEKLWNSLTYFGVLANTAMWLYL